MWKNAEAKPPNNCWNEQIFTLGSWRGCLWGLGVVFLHFHMADAKDPIMGQWTGVNQNEHLWTRCWQKSANSFIRGSRCLISAPIRHASIMSASDPATLCSSLQQRSKVGLIQAPFPPSPFQFSAALNNAAFINEFKCLFLELIIAFICSGLCRAPQTNPAMIWDHKTPSFSSYWCDITLCPAKPLAGGGLGLYDSIHVRQLVRGFWLEQTIWCVTTAPPPSHTQQTEGWSCSVSQPWKM